MNRIGMTLLVGGYIICCALSTACNNDQAWLAELDDPAPVKRAGAVRILWKRGDEQAYRFANRALVDKSSIVRIAAVRALADFKNRDTTVALIRALRDRDPEVRQEAIRALGTRKSPQAQHGLVGLLERGETNSAVASQAEKILHQWGISPAQLADSLIARRLQRIRRSWSTSRGQQRALLVRQAGYLASREAIPLILQGLADHDGTVVLAALEVLQGRGGQQALQQLVELSASESPELRVAAVRALAYLGQPGLEVIAGRLRDNDSLVRMEALRVLVESQADFDSNAACQLLVEEDLPAAGQVIALLGRARKDCPEQILQTYLQEHKQQPLALVTLAELNSPTVLRILTTHKPAVAENDWYQAALALAGLHDRKLAGSITRRLESLHRQVEKMLVSWPGSRLGPLRTTASTVDKSRLSAKQLEKLYGKYHLKPRPNSPHGVADLLAPFRARGDTFAGRFFDPLGPRLREEIATLFRALNQLDPQRARDLAGGFLELDDDELPVAIMRELAAAGNVSAKFKPEELSRLEQLLENSTGPSARVLAEVLAGEASDGAAKILVRALEQNDWDRREAILAGLSNWKGSAKLLSAALARLLQGNSAASASLLLARLGAKQYIPAIRAARDRAGPAEELEILQALAQLGDQSILPRLEQMLLQPDPRIRLKVVEILASFSNHRAEALLERASFDIDRRVRQAARADLHRGKKQ